MIVEQAQAVASREPQERDTPLGPEVRENFACVRAPLQYPSLTPDNWLTTSVA